MDRGRWRLTPLPAGLPPAGPPPPQLYDISTKNLKNSPLQLSNLLGCKNGETSRLRLLLYYDELTQGLGWLMYP